ncbi:hypothetical protein GCM10010232_31890 [Streptomyces amakusaensis]
MTVPSPGEAMKIRLCTSLTRTSLTDEIGRTASGSAEAEAEAVPAVPATSAAELKRTARAVAVEMVRLRTVMYPPVGIAWDGPGGPRAARDGAFERRAGHPRAMPLTHHTVIFHWHKAVVQARDGGPGGVPTPSAGVSLDSHRGT